MDRPAFLIGGGKAAEAIERFDWSKSSLGPMEQWPQSLKTALSMMLLSHFPKAITWGRERITFHNDAFEPILGDKPPALGRPFSDVWAEAWTELKPMVDKAYAGEATFIENFPLLINRRGYLEQAYFTFCYSPIRVESGQVGGMMDTVIETTQTVVTEQRLSVTNAELSHRMRNVLTMVGAISAMSLRYALDLEQARKSLSQRLAALGRNQSFLSPDGASEASISELINQALAAHPDLVDRVELTGTQVRLTPSQALALSLALNELITNAIKYGAFSGPDGTVAVTWDATGFTFQWQEFGTSSNERPSREGFGTRVLMQFVPASFDGRASVSFTDDGLLYELVAPPEAINTSGVSA